MGAPFGWPPSAARTEGRWSGCPRTGNRHFSRDYNFSALGGKTFRIVNENDAVCRIPLRAGYRHVGRQWYLDWRGRVFEDAGYVRRGYNQVVGRSWAYWRRKDWHMGITRHLMHGDFGYIKTLEGLV